MQKTRLMKENKIISTAAIIVDDCMNVTIVQLMEKTVIFVEKLVTLEMCVEQNLRTKIGEKIKINIEEQEILSSITITLIMNWSYTA